MQVTTNGPEEKSEPARPRRRSFFAGLPDQSGGITLAEAVICLLAVVAFVAAIKFLGYHADEALTFLGAAVMLAGMIATHRARR